MIQQVSTTYAERRCKQIHRDLGINRLSEESVINSPCQNMSGKLSIFSTTCTTDSVSSYLSICGFVVFI